nr:PREDICTED: synaptotagmin-16 [Bemisia tabaci]
MIDLHQRSQVSVEASAFLGFSVAVVFVCLLFLLYFNRKCTNTKNCNDEVFTISGPTAHMVRKGASFERELGKQEFGEEVFKRLQMKIKKHHPHEGSKLPSQININVHTRDGSGDLISLAEKGRMGRGSCSSSTSGSSTSGEEEHALRHRDSRYTNRPERPDRLLGLARLQDDRAQHCVVTMPQESSMTSPVESCRSTMSPLESPRVVTFGERHRQSSSESRSFSLGSPGTETDDSSLEGHCGYLEVAFAYDAPMRKMTVHVLQARGISSADRGSLPSAFTHSQVRLQLLPSKKQKHKSKIRHGENPQFVESFMFNRINPEEVNGMGIRVRLYACARMRRVRLIGETVVAFASINLELENNIWLTLEPKVSSSALSILNCDKASLSCSESVAESTISMQHGGVAELLVGLAYNPTTGCLSVEIIKGSHFRNLGMTKAPDTYVKLWLVSSTGVEIAHSKTSVRRGQPNPLFKQTFIFQAALFQLPDVTLMVAVYDRRPMKRKDMLGWFSLGQNSSGEEELAHWDDMRQVNGEQIARWHVLLDT